MSTHAPRPVCGPSSFTDLALQLEGSYSGPAPTTDTLELKTEPLTAELPTYGRILQELLSGGSDLAVGAEQAELAWRIVTPVLEAWEAGRVALEEYSAGSSGPDAVG